MAEAKFQVRETTEGLQNLDKIIKELGYRDRADWFREMKRRTTKEYEERNKRV